MKYLKFSNEYWFAAGEDGNDLWAVLHVWSAQLVVAKLG
jgi:hypothetical protein